MNGILLVSSILLLKLTEGFAPINYPVSSIPAIRSCYGQAVLPPTPLRDATTNNNALGHNKNHRTALHMSDDNNQGPGLGTTVFISGVLLFFMASAFAPLLDFASITPSANDLSLGDSVVTRQDAGGSKLKNYQSKFDALSPGRVQEKLKNLPVFYLSDGDAMGENIYLSVEEAEGAANSASMTVKATTLDRVMYPLILKRETTMAKMGSTPAEIKKAKEAADDGRATYSLVPSRAALKDAGGIVLKEGRDIPLFVVERLAFASDDGRPQVPLFTERDDALVSYARLRESGGNKLPEEPAVRTTSLLDVLESMEGGTRPGVGQLQFYGRAEDVMRADEMMSK